MTLPQNVKDAVDIDYAPGELDRTAPERIWLQVDTDGDNNDRDEPWPGDEATWCAESIGGLEIQYVRADLSRTHLLSQEAELADYKNASLHAADDCVAKDAEIARLQTGLAKHVARACELESRLAAADAQLRLMHRVLSQAVCVACADDGVAKDHELDKLDGVLRDQGWITTAVVPSTPTDAHLQGAGDE